MRVHIIALTGAVVAMGCGGLAQLAETTPVLVAAAPPAEPEPEPVAEPEGPIQVLTDRIQVDQRINFAFNSDAIEASSFGLLDELAAVLAEHHEVLRVRIEGHTDNVGGPGYNQDLSSRRAAAILRYLSDHGVSADRLSSRGYGASQPRSSNDTESGRAENRRVEFTIVETAEGSQS